MEKINFTLSNSHSINKIEGRKALFLDSNIWIILADEKSNLALKIKNRLIMLVENGAVFCPLSAPIISELYKQIFLICVSGWKTHGKVKFKSLLYAQ